MLTLLLGGAKSGKSALAIKFAKGRSGPSQVAFVATAEQRDPEMTAKAEAHRSARPTGWRTVEEPLALAEALASVAPGETAVVDCLTLWVSNVMEAGWDDGSVLRYASTTAQHAAGMPGLVVAVSNEVGSGIVPADALTRRYRDLLGKVNTVFSEHAQDAFLVVAGRLLALQRPPLGTGLLAQ